MQTGLADAPAEGSWPMKIELEKSRPKSGCAEYCSHRPQASIRSRLRGLHQSQQDDLSCLGSRPWFFQSINDPGTIGHIVDYDSNINRVDMVIVAGTSLLSPNTLELVKRFQKKLDQYRGAVFIPVVALGFEAHHAREFYRKVVASASGANLICNYRCCCQSAHKVDA